VSTVTKENDGGGAGAIGKKNSDLNQGGREAASCWGDRGVQWGGERSLPIIRAPRSQNLVDSAEKIENQSF